MIPEYSPGKIDKSHSDAELTAVVLLSLGLLLVVVSESVSWILVTASVSALILIYANRLLISLMHNGSKDRWIVLPLNYAVLIAGLACLLVMLIPLKYPVGFIQVLLGLLALVALYNLFAGIPEELYFCRLMRFLRILLLIVLLLLLNYLPAIRE